MYSGWVTNPCYDVNEKKAEALGSSKSHSALGEGDGSMTVLGSKELLNRLKNRTNSDKDIEDTEIILSDTSSGLTI